MFEINIMIAVVLGLAAIFLLVGLFMFSIFHNLQIKENENMALDRISFHIESLKILAGKNNG